MINGSQHQAERHTAETISNLNGHHFYKCSIILLDNILCQSQCVKLLVTIVSGAKTLLLQSSQELITVLMSSLIFWLGDKNSTKLTWHVTTKEGILLVETATGVHTI